MSDIKQKLDKIRERLSDPSFLANKGLSNEVGIHVFCYEDKRVLKSVAALEKKRGSDYLLKQLQKIATPEALLEYMKYEPHEKGDVLVLTGIGKIYPFMRSHKMLDSMQHLFEDIPIVMFYPVSFNGQDLGLFGRFLDGHYYRAFNLL